MGAVVDNDFRLASWLVQPSLNTVSRNGTTVQLEPKVMSVLVCLAEHPGEPISKEKLLQTVWPDTFVGEGVLVRSVHELRGVFQDDAKEPRIIETIAKRGYRLVAPMSPANGTSPVPALAEHPSELAPAEKAGRRRLWFSLLLGGAVLLLGLLAASNVGGLWTRLRPDNTPRIHSLAVLPLQNLSGDPAQEYFADGMTEELITELSRLNAFKVSSRTSIMRYKKSDKSLPEIARELNVDAIVEGSVLRSGDRVRITAQLIFARTDANLWAETYDRNLQDTLAVQEAVAIAIADKLKASMVPKTSRLSKTPTVNLKAHEAYLRGLHENDLGIEVCNHQGMQAACKEHVRRTVEYYRQAIHEDPNYALAYLALADGEDPNDAEAKARKALELDDTLSQAHLFLGGILLFRDLNWQGSEKEFLRAIEVNPNNAAAHTGYAYFLDAAGRLDDGMKEYQRAQELDPAKDRLAGAFYSRREYDRLIELEREALATGAPGNTDSNAVAHKSLMVAYARTGRHKESIEEFRSGLACMGFDGLAEEMRRGYVGGGYEGALRAYLRGVKGHPDWAFHWLETYAYTELGEYDQAFARLPKLKDDGGGWNVVADEGGVLIAPALTTLRIEPMWDPLHSDPRFEALVRRVGFPK